MDEVAQRAPALLRGDVWAAIRRSDALGGGVLQRFAAPRLTADGLAVSAAARTTPTTLRYVAVLAQLIARFGARRVPAAVSDLALDAYEICEVGGGYGGMAHAVLAWDAARFGGASAARIRYRIFDLVEVAALQRRYLGELGWSAPRVVATTLEAATRDELRHCDLVISNYALSELDELTQLRYSSLLIESARVGLYAAMNHFDAERRGRAFEAELAARGWIVTREEESVRDETGAASELVVGFAPLFTKEGEGARKRGRWHARRLNQTVH